MQPKILIHLILLLLPVSLWAAVPADTLAPPAETLEVMQRANAYFMEKWPDTGKRIVTDRDRASNIWTRAVYYEGLMALHEIDPQAEYYEYATDWADFHEWNLRDGDTYTRNADNQAAGQTYLMLYDIDPQPVRRTAIKASIDSMMRTDKIDDWTWIDAIQMGMPVFAQLGVMYDDPSYFERMYEMYNHTRNVEGGNGLYNPADNLWWRDADFDPPYTEPNGEDSYWSRGNGWVVMALARVLETIPEDEEHRAEYVTDFTNMMAALKEVQREDGFWNVSLHDPTHFGGPETSGTAMFVYGMAWGINHGYLDREEYLPALTRGWNAMVEESLHDSGFLGYMQSTGKEPKDGQPLSYDKIPDFEDYGLGAFLLAGTEVYRLTGGADSRTGVEVTVDERGYPRFAFANTGGDSIIISSVSQSEGSVGFRRGNRTYWAIGTPEVAQDAGGATTYTWMMDAGELTLRVESAEGEDLMLHLMAESNLEGHPQNMVNFAAAPDEYYTGIFERVRDGGQDESWSDGITTGLNLRGERVEMHLKPTVSAYAPFYISSAGYGFFAHGTWPGVFDFARANEQTVQVSFEGPEMDFRLYRGKSLKEIVQQHALETGPSLVPPDWALGPWRWRDEHFNEDTYYDGTPRKAPYNTDIVEDVLMMKAYDIPMTAIWIDRPWGPGVRGFDDYEFDTDRLPQPEKMIDWLNEQDIELMLWIGPFVMGDMADYAEENDFDLQSNRWKDSRQVLMDFTNPEAVEWWAENGPGKLARMGVKGYKLDRADGEKLQDSLHLKTYAGTTYRENFNDYPRQYVEATHKAVSAELGDDFVLFPRAQYTGSARFGSMWAGDTNGKAEGLRSAIIAMQRCAVMGYPVWGSDIGGYWGDYSQETTQRWLGLGCFSPIMETGPTNNEGFWNNPDAPVYDPELIATWRLYSKLRMKLVPYVSEQAELARETGTPIARPLFLDHPDEPEAWEDWSTYLFGPDLLVSVVWEKGENSQRLYLPAGSRWVDAWDKSQVYEGGQYITVDAPGYKTPVFVLEGADLDLGDLNALYQESLQIAASKPDLAELEAAEQWD